MENQAVLLLCNIEKNLVAFAVFFWIVTNTKIPTYLRFLEVRVRIEYSKVAFKMHELKVKHDYLLTPISGELACCCCCCSLGKDFCKNSFQSFDVITQFNAG